MHNAVKYFIREVRKELPHKFRLRKVLEEGSKNINGSPRKYFWLCHYTGIDLSAGKGVDMIGSLHSLYYTNELKDKSFDVVISTEMLEHNTMWQNSLTEMYSVLKPGGLLLITSASDDRLEHGTKRTTPECSPDTTDYYRNISKQDFKSILPPDLFR